MRTHFEVEEPEEYESAKELLLRRCKNWAADHGMRADEGMLSAALDSRHLSSDGRLGHWTPVEVRRLLLEWIPQLVVADPDTLNAAPESLLTLLRYLAASGLRDPRGASIATLEKAVAEAAADYPAALADPLRQGVGKFWTLAALDNGVDLSDGEALERFQRDVDAGRARYDGELLDRLIEASLTRPPLDQARAYAQLPVGLPPREELAAAAADSGTVRRLAALAGWVGADGRELTATGDLRPADARELARLLGTGEQDSTARGSTETPLLDLLFAWAKKARLVRVSKGRVLRVAKAAPLLRDPEALWRRAFETFFDLGGVVCAPDAFWGRSSPMTLTFDEILPDVLNTIYSIPHPTPVVRLQETVWLACREYLWLDDEEEDPSTESLRPGVERDLLRALEVLAGLGAVELSHGMADEMFSADLGDDFEAEHGEERPLPPEVCARLLTRLAEPGPLVRLTPLGVRAVRERMLAGGRDAPLVGELADEAPAEMLGVVAQHYTLETAKEEIEGWLAAHGGDVEPLLEAVRECPFRIRSAAMLKILVETLPDGRALLRGLRGDAKLRPLAVLTLVDEGLLGPEDLTGREQLFLITEGLLTLLELGGPEAVREQLAALPPGQASEIATGVQNSGHPDRVAVEEFRTLVAEQMRDRGRPLRLVRGQAPGARGRPSGHGKKRRR
ncbi:hypothetical protein [Streptosporangium sp. 'caverna']|uniref:hypothetical protein n=1 Tax=Streptosporangium sp. 'caverna' TaxID=2202249 RepID=UPI000D7DC111|nr:hypothetical protein [Streptosporangium sp. 'caverna']AWS46199.1 hypothetical protein DKM19_37815 [Streptosporangium sp. 'caverna']